MAVGFGLRELGFLLLLLAVKMCTGQQVGPVPADGLVCFRCEERGTDTPPNGECALVEIQCNVNQSCYSRTFNEGANFQYVNKGCYDNASCATIEANNDPGCADGVISETGGQCSYCCAQNFCNGDLYRGNETTTTSQPATTLMPTSNFELLTTCQADGIVLDEGGDEEIIRFRSIASPADLCAGETDCHIYAVISFEEKFTPRCWPDSSPLQQIACRPEVTPTFGWPCAVEITNNDEHFVALRGLLDRKRDGDQTRKMYFQYRKVVDGEVEEEGQEDECDITVRDYGPRCQCRSQNDPHMTTFDCMNFECQLEGKFVLYRSTIYPVEVQVEYQPCSSYGPVPTCNCGVAVRSGDFVYTASICDGGPLQTQYFSNTGTVTPGTTIFQTSNDIVVQLPQGTRVKILYYSGGSYSSMNVYITGSSADYQNTEGLCGYYDNSNPDVLIGRDGTSYPGPFGYSPSGHPNDFSNSWRVQEGEDICEGAPNADPWVPPEYCACEDDDTCNCDAGYAVSDCGDDEDDEVTIDPTMLQVPTPTSTTGKRRKRQSGPGGSAGSFSDPNRQYTEAQAQAFCDAYFNIPVVNMCGTIVGTPVQPSVEICVLDIEYLDNTDFAGQALDGYKEACRNDILQDPAFSDTDIGRDSVSGIFNLLCGDDCNGHGVCVEGKCQCTSSYVGNLCETSIFAIPHSLTPFSPEACNLRTQDCHHVILYAEDLINSNRLTCHISVVQVTETGVSYVSNVIRVPARWWTPNQVSCEIPGEELHSGYQIRLSNDASRVSTSYFLHIVYDPICFTCQISGNDGVCIRKENNCVINGRCYQAGELTNTNEYCDPTKPTEPPREEGLSRDAIIIIVVSVIIGCFLIIIIIVVCCCCCRWQNPSHRGHSSVTRVVVPPNNPYKPTRFRWAMPRRGFSDWRARSQGPWW